MTRRIEQRTSAPEAQERYRSELLDLIDKGADQQGVFEFIGGLSGKVTEEALVDLQEFSRRMAPELFPAPELNENKKETGRDLSEMGVPHSRGRKKKLKRKSYYRITQLRNILVRRRVTS